MLAQEIATGNRKRHESLFTFLSIMVAVVCINATNALAQTLPDWTSFVASPNSNTTPYWNIFDGLSITDASSISGDGLVITWVGAGGPTTPGGPLYTGYGESNNVTYHEGSDAAGIYYTNASGGSTEAVANCLQTATCSVSSIVYNGSLYLAYADFVTKGLTVLEGIPNGEPNGFTFQLAYTDPTFQITSAPSIVVAPNGNLIVRFGTSLSSTTPNLTTNAVLSVDGWATSTTSTSSPTQSAVVNFNGVLYAFDKSNDSDAIIESTLDNNGIVTGTPQEVPGASTAGGISAAVFNGSIVLAVQENATPSHMVAYSSSNGSTWTSEVYSNIVTCTPSIAVIGGGIAVASVGANGSEYPYSLFGSYATN